MSLGRRAATPMMSAASEAGPSQAQASPQRRRPQRPRCTTCGSRRFRRDADTGLVVCSLGHVLQGFREEETTDGDDFGSQPSQRSRRRLRVQGGESHRGRGRRGAAARNRYSNDEAYYLLLQCLQLLLRSQIQSLLRELPYIPKPFESVCRDLWAMHLTQQEVKLPGQSKGDASHDGAGQNSRNGIISELDASAREEALEASRRERDLRALAEDGYADEGFDSASAAPFSEDDDPYALESHVKRKRTRKVRGRQDMLTLLGILYLALVTLRIPVQWADIIDMISSGRLAFLHAVYQLPPAMVAMLPKDELAVLDQRRLPNITELSQRTLQVASDFHRSHGATFPELNASPLIWRMSERLMLSPMAYTATKAIFNYLDISMSPVPEVCLAPLDVGGRPQSNGQEPLPAPHLAPCLSSSLGRRSAPREVVIAAALIVYCKMRYGLDGRARASASDADASIESESAVATWLSALQHTREDEMRSTDVVHDPDCLEVLDLDDHQLDAYLNFAEKTMVRSDQFEMLRSQERAAMADLEACAPDLEAQFPLKKSVAETADEAQSIAADLPSSAKLEAARRRLEELYKQVSMHDIEGNADDADEPERSTLARDYTIFHPTSDSATIAQGLSQTRYARKRDGVRKRGRPRKTDFATSDGLDDQGSFKSALGVPPDLEEVMAHACRIVKCDMLLLANTLHALEMSLLRTVTARKRARETAQRRERNERLGLKTGGRRKGQITQRAAAQSASNEMAVENGVPDAPANGVIDPLLLENAGEVATEPAHDHVALRETTLNKQQISA